jgi:hypothetical protein
MLYNKSYLIDENKNKSQFLSNLFRRNKKIGLGLWFMVFNATLLLVYDRKNLFFTFINMGEVKDIMIEYIYIYE